VTLKSDISGWGIDMRPVKIRRPFTLYLTNSESMPINWDFLHIHAKNPQVQQAARLPGVFRPEGAGDRYPALRRRQVYPERGYRSGKTDCSKP
jgi:hypothetical protein